MQSVTFSWFPSPWIRPGFSSWTKEILNIYNNRWQGVAEFGYTLFRKNHFSLFLFPHTLNFIWSFLVIVWKATVNYQTTSKKVKWFPSVCPASPFHPSCIMLLISPVTTELQEQGASASTRFVLYFYLNPLVLVEGVIRLCIAVARTESRKACAIRSVLICCVGRLKTHPHRATRRRRSSLMIQYKNNPCVAHSGSWYIPSETGTPCAECCVAVAMRHQ